MGEWSLRYLWVKFDVAYLFVFLSISGVALDKRMKLTLFGISFGLFIFKWIKEIFFASDGLKVLSKEIESMKKEIQELRKEVQDLK